MYCRTCFYEKAKEAVNQVKEKYVGVSRFSTQENGISYYTVAFFSLRSHILRSPATNPKKVTALIANGELSHATKYLKSDGCGRTY